MLGMYPNFVPKFSKQFANLSETIKEALTKFKGEVEGRAFPTAQHSYTMKEEEFLKAFNGALATSEIARKLNQQLEKKPKVETTSKKENASVPYVKVSKKNIAIVGGGAMGSLVGGKIAACGEHNVWIVSSWKEHVDKINEKGLVLRNLDRSTQNVPIKATIDAEAMLGECGPADLAIVLVKSPQTKKAAVTASKLVQSKGLVLTLQNGLGNREIIAETLGDANRVIQGVTSQGSYLVESGHIWHTGEGNTTLSFAKEHAQAIREIAEMLQRAGFACDLTDDLDSMLWGKLIVNAGINPLTALLRVKNGVVASSETCREILGKTVQEGVEVASARGIKLPFPDPEKRALEVARATADNISSMLADVMRGSQTEIDSINGAIVREGEKLGVSVLINKTLCGLLSLPFVNQKPKLANFQGLL